MSSICARFFVFCLRLPKLFAISKHKSNFMQMIHETSTVSPTLSLASSSHSLFLLQLFKLNCNCFPLNAVVATVGCCCMNAALIQIEFSSNGEKRHRKKLLRGKEERNDKEFTILLAAPFKWNNPSRHFLHFNTYSLKEVYLNIISKDPGLPELASRLAIDVHLLTDLQYVNQTALTWRTYDLIYLSKYF